jgi:hypothetical protein
MLKIAINGSKIIARAHYAVIIINNKKSQKIGKNDDLNARIIGAEFLRISGPFWFESV